jgi:hypothetical protein
MRLCCCSAYPVKFARFDFKLATTDKEANSNKLATIDLESVER